jgi:subtilisin family serine protease
MGMKHVILRAPDTTVTRGLPRAGATTATPSPPVEVEVDDLKPSRAADVSRHRDVVAIAPVVPMKLIAPVDVRAAAAPAAPGPTWGVRAVGADTSPFTGEGIVVAVLDTGIDPAHPAFAGVQLVRRNFTGESDDDEHGHGTHCAGTIFGRTTGGKRIGVATGVNKALIGKVLGPQGGSSESIVSAIRWSVENGANVISMSLGMDFPGLVEFWQGQGLPVALATSRALEAYRANVQLFERLASLVQAESAFLQPTIIVAAAGNESRREVNADFEIAVAPPAVSEGIISVAALGQSATGMVVAPFSNTGANLSGPGVQVMSAKPGGGFKLMSGTSMATPHVAGVAALWAEKIKAGGLLTPLTLTGRLIGSSVSEGLKPGFDPFDIGAGLVKAPAA